jgi:hypothetical protein
MLVLKWGIQPIVRQLKRERLGAVAVFAKAYLLAVAGTFAATVSRNCLSLVVFVFAAMASVPADADDTSDLAAAAQNPVANMISLPLENNTYFDGGPGGDTVNVLNIQPVIPIHAGDWNLITRTIAPLIYVPNSIGGIAEIPAGSPNYDSTEFGLGDINTTVFLSPAAPGKIIWGIGPTLTLPTATDQALGSEKWSAGPSAVVLTTPKPWVLGVLARNIWSFAGDSSRADVNQLLVQPFVNYNMADGWYLTSAPIVTANWEASSDERWTVPIGGGVGKIFSIGSQPMNASVQSYYNIETPTFGPDWSLRLQLQFLFPQ